jgi:hypothetical protein
VPDDEQAIGIHRHESAQPHVFSAAIHADRCQRRSIWFGRGSRSVTRHNQQNTLGSKCLQSNNDPAGVSPHVAGGRPKIVLIVGIPIRAKSGPKLCGYQ